MDRILIVLFEPIKSKIRNLKVGARPRPMRPPRFRHPSSHVNRQSSIRGQQVALKTTKLAAFPVRIDRLVQKATSRSGVASTIEPLQERSRVSWRGFSNDVSSSW